MLKFNSMLSRYLPSSFIFGGILLTSFLFHINARELKVILLQTTFGWLIRSIHRWSSAIMVLFLILHIGRVYFTGGFKKPREVTWISGLILAIITFAFGVTGYSLPWDRIGYWACKIF